MNLMTVIEVWTSPQDANVTTQSALFPINSDAAHLPRVIIMGGGYPAADVDVNLDELATLAWFPFSA